MAAPARTRPPAGRGDGDARRRRRRRIQPTTAAAIVVLVGAVVAAGVVSGSGGSGAAAATVGGSRIAVGTVDREVSAILAEPAYRKALGEDPTVSLAAPVSPKAVAAANGDPDDLMITFAPVGGASVARTFSRADLDATVLTRLLYVTALEQLLAVRHVSAAADLADGRQQAAIESGTAANGKPLFDQLPGWYQSVLAGRAADVEALAEAIAGPGAVTPEAVQRYYDKVMASQYTTICISADIGGHTSAAGCAPMTRWVPAAVSAVDLLPVGVPSKPITQGGTTATLTVTRRIVTPLSAVRGSVVAEILAPYADAVDYQVTTALGLEKVTVAASYGTYENLGTTFGILPPDALSPPSPATGGTKSSGKKQPPPPQQFDPFS